MHTPINESTMVTRGVLNLRGACPQCGTEVHRRLTATGEALHEVYDCPTDGAMRYVQNRAPVGIADSIAPSVPTSTRGAITPWMNAVAA